MKVVQFFADQQAHIYLVGGSLRNLLAGDPCGDWDLVTDGEAHKLARRLADTLGGFYAHMHEKASRVVVRFPDAIGDLVLDIAPLHGQTLEEDLRARDFTLNAMAAPLGPVIEQLARSGSLTAASIPLIDPLGGLVDLQQRQLRAVDAEVFRYDPLRMLRALRLARRYTLTITPETEKLIRRDATLLPQVAAERIQAELYTLLAQPDALTLLYRLDTCGLLMVLFPELQAACGMRQPLPHYWDVLEHSLQSVHALEVLTAALETSATTPFASELAATPADGEVLVEIRELLREGEQQGEFRFADLCAARMKLVALLHDIGKPLTYTVDGQGGIHFYGHPQLGAPVAGEIMGRFSASTQDRRFRPTGDGPSYASWPVGTGWTGDSACHSSLLCRSGSNRDSRGAFLPGRSSGDSGTAATYSRVEPSSRRHSFAAHQLYSRAGENYAAAPGARR